MPKPVSRRLVVCVNSADYPASLVALRDAAAERQELLRVIDESGEDYLYPKALFRVIALPQSIKKALLDAA